MDCPDRDDSVEPCVSYLEGGFCTRRDRMRCTEWMKANAPSISYSALRSYSECPYKYYLGTIRGLRMIKPPLRLLMGKIVSECLDQVHSRVPTRTVVEIIKHYRGIYDEYRDSSGAKVYLPELCKLEGFMRAYVGFPISEDKGETQFEFRLKRVDYPQVHGYLDFVRQIDGEGGWGREFKYSTNPDGWGKFIVSGQLGTYFAGTSLQRIVLTVLRVPTLRPKKDENTDEFIERIYEEVRDHPKQHVIEQNYWRSEFDEDGLMDRYRDVTCEIYERLGRGEGAFWKTENQDAHFRCDFLPICETGKISEQLFSKEVKGDEVENTKAD